MSKKILIVDDEESALEVIYEFLKDENYQLVTADSATKAINILRADDSFDLVITDIIMDEGINGIELTEYIYQNHRHIKVLACSGGGDSGTFIAGMALDQALQQGANNAILKPFDQDELKKKVAELLR